MGNKKSKRKNSGGSLDCVNSGGILTRSSDGTPYGTCPNRYFIKQSTNDIQKNIKNTNQDNKVKSPIVTCKKDGAAPQSFLVSELEKTKIQVDNKEEERPLCPTDYYFDSVSKTPVAYQELIPEENAQKILNEYEDMAKKTSSGGKRKRTFRRRKQRKQRKTSKK